MFLRKVKGREGKGREGKEKVVFKRGHNLHTDEVINFFLYYILFP
jgi:hypothetical protein